MNTTLSAKAKHKNSLLGAAMAAGLILLPAGNAAADGGYFTLASLNIQQGTIYFGTTSQPPNTCSYFGRYFKFNASSPEGKNMYAALLAAQLTGRNIFVWYNPSMAIGT